MTTATPCQQKMDHPSQPTAHVPAGLTCGGNQAWIAHSGQVYVLRSTRADELILTT
jgi:hemin uptake protein HemP